MKLYPLCVIGNHEQNGEDKPEIYGIKPGVEGITLDGSTHITPTRKVIVRFVDQPDNPKSAVYNREVALCNDQVLYAF